MRTVIIYILWLLAVCMTAQASTLDTVGDILRATSAKSEEKANDHANWHATGDGTVPEPATLLLLGTGALFLRRRKND